MTTQPTSHDVEFLIPARFQQARRQAIDAIVAELSATIAALPTVSTMPHAGDDPDQFKRWASAMIGNLPTRKTGDSDHGTR